MQITRSTDYGMRVLTRLAMTPPATRLTAGALASESRASEPLVAKILQRPVAARLSSAPRVDGGFELARHPRDISVLDIVTALEGPLCLNACLPGGAGCDDSETCAARDVWARAQNALAGVLAGETLERLAEGTRRSPAVMPGIRVAERHVACESHSA